jgi:carbon monoxide dehydrogenase subunit G
MELQGEERIKNANALISFLSKKENLIVCIPGVTQSDGDKFTSRAKVGFISIELKGEIVQFEVNGNQFINTIQIQGAGMTITVKTTLLVDLDILKWKVEYEAQGELAKSFKKIINEQAEKVAKDIISCSLQRSGALS